jgi:hypothetical protein
LYSEFSVVSAVRIIEFAEMLQGSINEKIKECKDSKDSKDSIHEGHDPKYNKSLEVEI